jgi:hypothetical protein
MPPQEINSTHRIRRCYLPLATAHQLNSSSAGVRTGPTAAAAVECAPASLDSPRNRTPPGGVGHTDVNGGSLRWAGNRGAGAEATRAGATRVARTDSGPNRDIQIGVGVYPQLDRL